MDGSILDLEDVALFQGMVGKLSPPRIEVDLTQDEEVEMVGGPVEYQGPVFLGIHFWP